MSERLAYVHAGTHKTGTTAIQTFMAMNEPALAQAGILWPRSGRVTRWGSENSGHHNLAWELAGFSRFMPEEGTFDNALMEIAATAHNAVVLSSEDFYWLRDKPESLRFLRDRFASLGYVPKIILYLRAQNELVQALCMQQGKEHQFFDFDAIMAEVFEAGTFPFSGSDVHYELQYTRLADAFSAVFGAENIIVRPYMKRAPQLLLREFLNMVGGEGIPQQILLQPSPTLRRGDVPLEARSDQRFINASPSFLHVLRGMHQAVLQQDPAAAEPERIINDTISVSDISLLHRPFDVMTDPERTAMLRRFAHDNAEVVRRYGAGPPFLDNDDLRARTALESAAARSQRLVLDAAVRRWKAPGEGNAA